MILPQQGQGPTASAMLYRASAWRRRCSVDNGCVEVARLDADTAGFRDNTRSGSPVLVLGIEAFSRFLEQIKRGAFDV